MNRVLRLAEAALDPIEPSALGKKFLMPLQLISHDGRCSQQLPALLAH